MARTIIQIYEEMIEEKNLQVALNSLQPNIDTGQTFLNDLTSASKVAVWRSMFFVIAFGIWSLEKLFDEHITWINNRAKELIVGNPAWYQKIALEFQYGDSLVFNGTTYDYEAVNDSLKIVKLASVNEVGGQVLIKIAKLVDDVPEALEEMELDSFKNYIKKRKFAGVRTVSVSRDPDLLKIRFRIYIDPLIMNLSGELISDTGIKPVEAAINDYCVQLPFDGIFSVTELTDKIQEATGVLNPVFESASAKYGANPYAALVDYYNPNAGYLKVDPLFPLSASITYLLP